MKASMMTADASATEHLDGVERVGTNDRNTLVMIVAATTTAGLSRRARAAPHRRCRATSHSLACA